MFVTEGDRQVLALTFLIAKVVTVTPLLTHECDNFMRSKGAVFTCWKCRTGTDEKKTMHPVSQCAGCCLPIHDRFMLSTMGKLWHEDCLKCMCCQCRLGELGSKLYFKKNLILCPTDYQRIFGQSGVCSICEQTIPAFELVMRSNKNVYHLKCFACQICNYRFCVGDTYCLCDGMIMCQYDYEERLMFQQAAFNNRSRSELTRNLEQLTDFETIDENTPRVRLP